MQLPVALIALLALPSLGHAALITYRDEKGTLHAVESENDIPEKYRKGAKSLRGETRDAKLQLQKVQGGLLVEVYITGIKGAQKMVVNPDIAQTTSAGFVLGILGESAKVLVPVITEQGETKEPFTEVPEITLGGLSVKKVRTKTAEPGVQGAAGVLGADFLGQFNYRLDKEAGELYLEKKTK